MSAQSHILRRVYTTARTLRLMDDGISVREARANLASLINRAEAGDSTVITRNGTAVAAIVPIDEYQALEDAADELLAREARQQLDEPTVSMAELLADRLTPPVPPTAGAGATGGAGAPPPRSGRAAGGLFR